VDMDAGKPIPSHLIAGSIEMMYANEGVEGR
jgi:hypothetical protein